MKYCFFFFVLTLFTVEMAWAQPAMQAPHAVPGPSSASITPAEWQELRSARGAALQANPDLLANNKKLIERMRALEDKVDAAMIKADPNLTPIIAKFEANRPHLGASASTVTNAAAPAK